MDRRVTISDTLKGMIIDDYMKNGWTHKQLVFKYNTEKTPISLSSVREIISKHLRKKVNRVGEQLKIDV